MISPQLHTQLYLSATIFLVSQKNEPLPGIYFTQDSLKRFISFELFSLKMYKAFLSTNTRTHTHYFILLLPLTTTNKLLRTSV